MEKMLKLLELRTMLGFECIFFSYKPFLSVCLSVNLSFCINFVTYEKKITFILSSIGSGKVITFYSQSSDTCDVN